MAELSRQQVIMVLNSGGNLAGVDLTNLDLTNLDLSAANVARANLSGANLAGVVWGAGPRDAMQMLDRLRGVNLCGANLSSASWADARPCEELRTALGTAGATTDDKTVFTDQRAKTEAIARQAKELTAEAMKGGKAALKNAPTFYMR